MLVIAVNMMRASSSSLGSKAHCSPSVAIGCVWAAGGAANMASASRCGMLPFIRAHSRMRKPLVIRCEFTRVSNFLFNRTATALRASAAG